MGFLQHSYTKPYITVLLVMVSSGALAGLSLSIRNLAKDPNCVWLNRHGNPFPWLHVSQDCNLKLISVNRKWENSESQVKPTFS